MESRPSLSLESSPLLIQPQVPSRQPGSHEAPSWDIPSVPMCPRGWTGQRMSVAAGSRVTGGQAGDDPHSLLLSPHHGAGPRPCHCFLTVRLEPHEADVPHSSSGENTFKREIPGEVRWLWDQLLYLEVLPSV